ncbi:DUF5694 domain-containing protein [Flavobacterium sp. W22_SRS_FK3]|uniref:DUF5694 domain-containing protein n=1 Tax=Flavobacterium sp. W22_SRS_FK3 TaxID=3240275 RepID=UPI003F93317A
MTLKKVINTLILTSVISSQMLAQKESITEILLVGFDHLGQMDNGTPSSDIFSQKKQQEIIKITEKLKVFSPDLIMVEKEPSEQNQLDSLYSAYRNNYLKLSDIEYGASETYQVGFRLAKILDLKSVYGIDHYESTSQSLLNSGDNIKLFKNGLTELMNTARPLKKKVQQDSLSIYDYIKTINQDKFIDLSHNLIFNLPAYVINGEFSETGTNTVDIGEIDKKYIGAEYITLFYNRNLKIYSNILNTELKHNSNKILLIMGQLHIGVLKDLFEHNRNYKIIEISEYLN